MSLLIGLTCILTNLADTGAALFCSCQVFRFDFCCDFLRAFGVGCPSASSLPTVFFLFPVSLYSLAFGVSRTTEVFASASSASRDIIWTASLVVAYAAYAVLLLVIDNDVASNFLVLLVCHTALFLAGSVIFLGHNLKLGTSVAYFPTTLILALQGYLSLGERYPGVYMILPLCGYVLCVTSALRAVPGGDVWSRLYALGTSAVGIVIFVTSFDDLRPSVGTTYVAYFCSFAGRVILFGLDSHYISLIFSVVFCVVDMVFTSYVMWWTDNAPLLSWVATLSVTSLCVAVATLVSKVYDIKQVEDDLRKNISTVVNTEKVTVPSSDAPPDQEKLLRAFKSGVEAGNRALQEFQNGRLDPRDLDRFFEVIREKDVMQLSDSTAVRTTRMRIYFVKGVCVKIPDALEEKAYDALLNKFLWTLGVPRRLFLSTTPESGFECSRVFNGLDVGWAPGDDDEASYRLSLSRLIALRAKATREAKLGRDEDAQKRVERRYRFVAGTVSFKTADKIARYERHWDIVWT